MILFGSQNRMDQTSCMSWRCWPSELSKRAKAGRMVHHGAYSIVSRNKIGTCGGFAPLFKVSHTRIFQGIWRFPGYEWLSRVLRCKLCLCQAPRTEYASTSCVKNTDSPLMAKHSVAVSKTNCQSAASGTGLWPLPCRMVLVQAWQTHLTMVGCCVYKITIDNVLVPYNLVCADCVVYN